MSAHNSRLIAPCSQLQPPKFRVRSLWADKESLLSLEGEALTRILSGVQPLLVGQLVCGLVTAIQLTTNRTPYA
ncbi:MAG: hypothetical protein KME49_32645 [Brasilonema octagenarum HA4186-MV1]|nr:hypothetical protein [Brasilonema octagenarum HA4186-MV1]